MRTKNPQCRITRFIEFNFLLFLSENPGQNFANHPADTNDGEKFSQDDFPYYQQNDQGQYDTEPYDEQQDTPETMDNKKAHIYRPRQQPRRKTINPLYIAVPAAGACVLLAIIIFAIYILKRQNALMAEYHQQHRKQQNQKLCPIYHGNLKLQHHHHHGNPASLLGQHQKLMHPNHPATNTKDLLSVQSGKHRQYSDCSSERSSTGSETKLLMKV